MQENNNEVLEVNEEKEIETKTLPEQKVSTLYFVNLIIFVAVIAFFVLGLAFRIASLHFRTVYRLEGGTIPTFFSISEVFLIFAILSSIGLFVYNFIMIFIEKTHDAKKRNTKYAIIALSILTLLILVLNLL